jgi:hypothetical protein
MIEFLIQPVNDDWLNLYKDQFAQVFLPRSFPSQPIEGWGDYRIRVKGTEIAFSYEDPGIQVSFEGGEITEVQAKQIIDEICINITTFTNQQCRVVPL